MKKAQNKVALLLCFIVSTLFMTCGCQNLFIPTNVPVILRDDSILTKSSSEQINIESYTRVSPGVVQDITTSGNNIILLTSSPTYNIDIYNSDADQLSSFVTSDKMILNGLYDSFDTGIYYAEKLIDPLNGNVDKSNHLVRYQ